MFKKIQIALAAAILISFVIGQNAKAYTSGQIDPDSIPQPVRDSQWYEAHGYFFNGQGYEYGFRGQQPRFQDRDTIAAVLREAGFDLRNDDKEWTTAELTIITTSIVKIMYKVGGLEGGEQLHRLLGNSQIHFVRRSHSATYPGATAERENDSIWFHDEMFSKDRSAVEMYGTVAHELGHIIGDLNYTADGRTLKDAFPFKPNGLGLVSPETATFAGHPEYFAEGVKLWVFPTYPTKWHLDNNLQGNWLTEMLSK